MRIVFVVIYVLAIDFACDSTYEDPLEEQVRPIRRQGIARPASLPCISEFDDIKAFSGAVAAVKGVLDC